MPDPRLCELTNMLLDLVTAVDEIDAPVRFKQGLANCFTLASELQAEATTAELNALIAANARASRAKDGRA